MKGSNYQHQRLAEVLAGIVRRLASETPRAAEFDRPDVRGVSEPPAGANAAECLSLVYSHPSEDARPARHIERTFGGER